MQDHPNTDIENPALDAEEWEATLEPYKGHPYDALQLGFRFAALKQLIRELKLDEAIAAIDRGIDVLYEHSDFRSVSRELFQMGIDGQLTHDQEELLQKAGIRF
ncbi:MAG TPA: hypothetical protein VFM05_10650 [Candidatus Saccharimonadales bacterium]|nr:hypothetical protein [Candidatus Saccharimonadales bacterium]